MTDTPKSRKAQEIANARVRGNANAVASAVSVPGIKSHDHPLGMMTQDEAEKLARELRPGKATLRLGGMSADKLRRLCDHILSGDMKREIENAAYRRGYRQAIEDATAAQPCTAKNPREDAYQHGRFDGVMDYGRAIRALIRPPAQKENGK